MAIADAGRHRLHTKLDKVPGEEDANVLIAHLPPSGWSDVARTRDLDALEERMNARFEILDLRLRELEARFDARLERCMREQTNRFFVGMGALITVATAAQTVIAATLG